MNRADLIRLLFEHTQSFNPDAWDTKDWIAMRGLSSQLADMDDRVQREYGRNVVADAHYALAGLEPNPGDLLGRAWQKFMVTDEFASMRQTAATGREEHAIVTGKLAQLMVDRFYKITVEGTDADTNPADPFAAQNRIELDANIAGQVEGQEVDESEFIDAMVPNADEAGESSDDAEGSSQLVRGIMAGLDADTPVVMFNKALDLAQLYDVSEYVDILGWAEQFAGGAARQSSYGREELTGYRLNSWCDDVVPEQMAAVAQGDPQAVIAMVENELTCASFTGNEPMGRGAVINLRDESDSMQMFPHPHNHRKALAMELAMAKVMNENNRDLVSMAWSSRVKRHNTDRISGIEPLVRTHIYGEPGMEEHVRTFMKGGTNLLPVLEEAVLLAEEWAEPCDILITSDMELMRNDDAWVQFNAMAADIVEDFKAAGGRVFGVFFGNPKTASKLGDWIDGCVADDDLRFDNNTGSIIEKIATVDIPGQKRKL